MCKRKGIGRIVVSTFGAEAWAKRDLLTIDLPYPLSKLSGNLIETDNI